MKMAGFFMQDIHEPFHSRKLLLFPAYHQPPQGAATSPSSHDHINQSTTLKNTLDANVIMVVSVLLCALICSLCMNSMIRCALRCSTLFSSHNSTIDNLSGTRSANTGIKKQALKTLSVVNYPGDLESPGLECAICLSEFAPGDRIRVLPKCNHRFHVDCIDKWLNSHSSCPNCRHCLIETCQKIAGTEALVSSLTPPGPPPQTVVRIAPLEPEGFVRNHHR